MDPARVNTVITIDSEEELLTYVDEAMREERLGEMWYTVDVEKALDESVAEEVVETLKHIRDEEREHFETFLEIESGLKGNTPPRNALADEAADSLDDLDEKPSLQEALAEKRDAEDQSEDLYLDIADAVRRSDLDLGPELDVSSIADTFERIAADEAEHRDSIAELLQSGKV